MKVLLISGSPRKKGNTEILLSYCEDMLKEQGLKTELINLSYKKINHCQGCNKCVGQNQCIQKDDFNEVYIKVLESKGLILASPVYVGMPTSLIMAFIQRATMVSFNNGKTLMGKIGGAISIGGEAGQLATIKDITQFYLVNEMIVVGSEYWNIGVASKKGDIKVDVRSKEYINCFIKNVSNIIKQTGGLV